jgi:hypothetical protein
MKRKTLVGCLMVALAILASIYLTSASERSHTRPDTPDVVSGGNKFSGAIGAALKATGVPNAKSDTRSSARHRCNRLLRNAA